MMRSRWLMGLLLMLLLLSGIKVQAATYAFKSAGYSWETANTNVVWDQTQTAYPRDDDTKVINIGFTFTYAGVNYTQVRVHANGALQFGADTQFHRQFNNTDLPVSTVPPACGGCTAGVAADRLMLVYWDDINPRLGGTVRFQTKGAAPNRRLVVSWEAVPHYNLGGTYSFQVILHESGEFVYQYGTGNASGVSATIGVEVDNADYTLYSFNSSYSYAGTAIRWFIPSGEPDRLAEYRFEEGALNGTVNEVIDWSGHGYHGQAVGAAASEPGGYICRGVRIPLNSNTSSSAINTNLDVDAAIGNSGSITFWYRADEAWNSNLNQLLDATTQNNRWFFLAKRQNRNLRFVMSDSVGTNAVAETSGQTVGANTWKHIAVTWRFAAGTNQTVLRIYVDGSQATVAQSTTNGSLASSLGTLFVGDNRSAFSGQSGTPNSAEGTFDSVRVYNYEISNADVQADMLATHPCIVIDHIRILHDGAGLTCNPESLTLQACANSQCSAQYTGSVSTTVRLEGVAVGTASFSGGSGSLLFNQRSAGTFTLDAVSTSPPVAGLSDCQLGTTDICEINFADSGFLIDVPNLLAAKPTAATIRAIKKDVASQACVPGFADVTRTLSFSSAYSNPSTGTQPVVINGSNVAASPTAISLDFDSTGSAPFTVRYDDAGQMNLTASYSGTDDNDDAGLNMSDSDLFVSKPYGLLLQTDTDSGCTADIDCPLYAEGSPKTVRRAGDLFSLRIKAVAWECVGVGCPDEPLTSAALANNLVTPNFQLSNIALASQVMAPAGGNAGTLDSASYSHVVGNQTTLSQSISEVGVFQLTATPAVGSYLDGESVSGGTSGLVGRFAPAYLEVARTPGTLLTPSCANPDPLNSFSYQGQPMGFATGAEPSLEIAGHNRQGAITTNYDRGTFWRLTTAPERSLYSSVTGVASLDQVEVVGPPLVPARLQESGTTQSAYLVDSSVGDGALIARWSDQQLWYSPAVVPTADDLPFPALVSLNVPVDELKDADGVCYTRGVMTSGAACENYFSDADPSADRGPGFGGSKVRLGRLSIGNAHGSELQPLDLPVRLESWQTNPVPATGNSFQIETLDACTAAALGAPVLAEHSGSLTETNYGDTKVSLLALAAGQGSLHLQAPMLDGSVQAAFEEPPALTWLYYDWDATGDVTKRRAAFGLATFGIYKGAVPLIFRRESYR